ncbi:TBCD protein [Coprinopsis marcescibilis]|uniref:TBCD protein n=1 Tax=Coprinopsis marcescibilis TaxID=230819 RepID=A0A5C3L554_COPMA|nr:TBCD protein [Coprinopsis marcescibilis]
MADEDSFFAAFEQYKEFSETQTELLSQDLFEQPTPDVEREEFIKFKFLQGTLSGYQEQSYLLDPYLEDLVTPVVECLKSHAKTAVKHPERIPSSSRVQIISEILYGYTKFRGYKAIESSISIDCDAFAVRFFPHEIMDLAIVLDYTRLRGGLIDSPYHWALRYVFLLWLSLICMIPFDLCQFDEPGNMGGTATALEELAKGYLDKAGLEREGAALLLSRLYTRKDTASRFHEFVNWSAVVFKENNGIFMLIGILRVLAEVGKSGSLEQIKAEQTSFITLVTSIGENGSLQKNPLIRKYRSKILTRIALRLLPSIPGKTLEGHVIELRRVQLEETDVPEDVEVILEQMFDSLQDKETVVRWSAAKGVARIAEHLPADFALQIVETVLGLFSVHSIAAASLYDLPSIAEATWHGACLCCAELARRNLIPESHMSQLVEWLSKALYFDIRKGAHSIGSNVRDAAAYVLWALARTQDIPTLEPHANTLANHLVSVAIYDREVHIRRAASAAFQEHVGRTNLFPHGIDVLGKTDFYSVSIRKHSFLIAAPQVASHLEYRTSLLTHVTNVVLRHWDVSMRELGSQSVRNLCLIDLDNIAPWIPLLDSVDPIDVHGGLLALTEIGKAYQDAEQDHSARNESLHGLLGHLTRVSVDLLKAPRNHLITEAACRLTATTLTVKAVKASTTGLPPAWRTILDVGLKHRQTSVQDAAAEALENGSSTHQQGLAKCLEKLDYTTNKELFPKAIACLTNGLNPTSAATIETRQALLVAVPSICVNVVPKAMDLMSTDTAQTLFNILLTGLEDYAIDERGDVGSWARIASIQGLTTICELFMNAAGSIPRFEEYFPSNLYSTVVSAVLKQGVERLDNVRQEVGKGLERLLRCQYPSDDWSLPGFQLLKELFTSESEHSDWADAAWLFPRALKLLDLPTYRQDILSGAINSISSKTDSTKKEMSKALAGITSALPVADGTGYNVLSLLDDLLDRVTSNGNANKLVIPIFQAFNVLLEENCLELSVEDDRGVERLRRLVTLTTKNVGKWKNVQRILEAMKMQVSAFAICILVVNLLVFAPIRETSVQAISEFLAHPFPKVRYDTAEYFYMKVSSEDYGIDDTTDIENILLETRWYVNRLVPFMISLNWLQVYHRIRASQGGIGEDRDIAARKRVIV